MEQLIGDLGYYPWRAEPGELAEMQAAGTLDELLLKLMRERLRAVAGPGRRAAAPAGATRSTGCSATTTRPTLAALLDSAPWGEYCEGRDVLVETATR